MELFQQLEQTLRKDPEFMNKKIGDMLDVLNDEGLIEDLFDLQGVLQKYVDHVLNQKELSSLDSLNDKGPFTADLGLYKFILL